MNTTKDKISRRHIAEAFRQAKIWLRTPDEIDSFSNKQTFICCALDEAGHMKEEAQEIIRTRMGNFYTLNDWVVENIPGATQEWADSYEGREAVQYYRHRWLYSLIQEFSK